MEKKLKLNFDNGNRLAVCLRTLQDGCAYQSIQCAHLGSDFICVYKFPFVVYRRVLGV